MKARGVLLPFGVNRPNSRKGIGRSRTMVTAIRVHETGGPEVMRVEDIEVGQPGAGEVLLRHTAIGVNFIDTYFRTGLYKTSLPFVPGNEAAGVIEAIGDGVTTFKP